jgi:hypothetical protein
VRWLVACGVVFFAVAFAWLARDPELARKAYGKGSSLDTGPDGLSLARAYLAEKEKVPVTTLARPAARAQLPPDAVLFRVQPRWFAAARAAHFEESRDGGVADGGIDGGTSSASDAGIDAGVDFVQRELDRRSPLLTPEEEEWVSGGGRLVLAVDQEYGPLRVTAVKGDRSGKVFPALSGVGSLDGDATARRLVGTPLAGAVTVFAAGDAPALARLALGRGDVWMLAEPEVLDNDHLAEGGNLAFLLALAGRGRPVVFDEAVHGLSDEVGVFELLRRWGLGPACFLLALAGIAWFWRGAVAIGPESPFRDLRTESVDLAYAVGQLYQRALAPRDALVLHYERLVREVQLRLGLTRERALDKARELSSDWSVPAEGKRIRATEFRNHVEALNRAFRRLRDGRTRRR